MFNSDDFFITIMHNSQQFIVHITYGDGSNLLKEDRVAGYDAYYNYDLFVTTSPVTLESLEDISETDPIDGGMYLCTTTTDENTIVNGILHEVEDLLHTKFLSTDALLIYDFDNATNGIPFKGTI